MCEEGTPVVIQGAIFDMDGTLTDSNPYWDRVPEAFLAAHGRKAAPDLARTVFSMTLPEAADYIIKEYSLEMSAEDIISGVYETMERFYMEEVELKPGVRRLLELLSERKIPMTVATVTGRDLVEKVLGRHGVLSFFESIVTTDDAGVGKHDPAVYRMAAERIGSSCDRTMVLEDAPHALMTAKNAGFITIGVYDEASADAQDKIRETADLYLPDYKDLSGLMKLL